MNCPTCKKIVHYPNYTQKISKPKTLEEALSTKPLIFTANCPHCGTELK